MRWTGARGSAGSSLRAAGRRIASLLAIAVAGGFALATVGCGGGSASGADGGALPPMVLTNFLFTDRSLTPTYPTGVKGLPRNAELMFVFSADVDPSTVNDNTIEIRFGSLFQSVPKGSFQVDGNRVMFDPTVTSQ